VVKYVLVIFAARNCGGPIIAAINRHYKGAGHPTLDFGWSVGRVLQYFIGKGFELHACDSAIAYIKQPINR
jgi:hypothetical protein